MNSTIGLRVILDMSSLNNFLAIMIGAPTSFTYVRVCYVMRVNPVKGTSYEVIKISWYVNYVEIINPYTDYRQV